MNELANLTHPSNRGSETPRVSVVMPVHNALPFLDAAIQSILAQTIPDFEFVILDDASTDGSTERLREWAKRDLRIRLIEVKENLGPVRSSNRVAREARGAIVARQDADDISHPRRIEKQLEVLAHHPDVGVVGGLYEFIDSSGRKIRDVETWRLFEGGVIPPFGNGPLTYRKEVFKRIGGYREACEFWEDKDLIFRMAAVSKVLVIPEAIYQVRQSSTSTRAASERANVEIALDLAFRCIDRLEQGKGYDDLLKAGTVPEAKLDPRIFVALGSITLWSGGRPRLFRRLLRRARLRSDFRTLTALVWAAWASLEPTSLRGFLTLLLRAREARAANAFPDGTPVIWGPSGIRRLEEIRSSEPV